MKFEKFEKKHKSCIRARMFTTKGTSRVGHASDVTVRKISFPSSGGISIEIRNNMHGGHVLTTLEPHERYELQKWLNDNFKGTNNE